MFIFCRWVLYSSGTIGNRYPKANPGLKISELCDEKIPIWMQMHLSRYNLHQRTECSLKPVTLSHMKVSNFHVHAAITSTWLHQLSTGVQMDYGPSSEMRKLGHAVGKTNLKESTLSILLQMNTQSTRLTKLLVEVQPKTSTAGIMMSSWAYNCALTFYLSRDYRNLERILEPTQLIKGLSSSKEPPMSGVSHKWGSFGMYSIDCKGCSLI